MTVCESPTSTYSLGATWASDGTIFFTAGGGQGLSRVSSEGGTPEMVPGVDGFAATPQVLPDGKRLLYATSTKRVDYRLAVLSLDTGERHLIPGVADTMQALYLQTEHLLCVQLSGAILAVPFDLELLEPIGTPISILDDTYVVNSLFTVSDSGSLVYVTGDLPKNNLVLVDRQGKPTPIWEDGMCWQPRFSPDGRRVAAMRVGGIWTYDIERRLGTRLITSGTAGGDPVWTPDGARLVFASPDSGSIHLRLIASDGSGEEQSLLTRDHPIIPHSWSPDGALAFYEVNPETARDIWILPLEGDPEPFFITPFNERSPAFSPDGHWIAYVSDESGRDEVYVRAYPGPGRVWTVSTEGGVEPVWSAGGRELFYRNGYQMLSVVVETAPAFSLGAPRLLFEGKYVLAGHTSGSLEYDVSPDGQQFVMIQRSPGSEPNQIHVVLNWFEELKRLVPTEN